VADAAGRTSGALYAHFGGKEGLLTALLDTLTNETAAVITTEQPAADDPNSRLAALWRTLTEPPTGHQWLMLEHELWLYACRHPEARATGAAARFEQGRRRLAASVRAWTEDADAQPPGSSEQVAGLLIALLIGLEMEHRLDPDAIHPETALAALRAITGVPAGSLRH